MRTRRQAPYDPDPKEVRLVVHAPLDTQPGQIDVRLGFGRGSAGPGRRPADDTALYVATLRRLAMHLLKYDADYEQAHHGPDAGRGSGSGGVVGATVRRLLEQSHER